MDKAKKKRRRATKDSRCLEEIREIMFLTTDEAGKWIMLLDKEHDSDTIFRITRALVDHGFGP